MNFIEALQNEKQTHTDEFHRGIAQVDADGNLPDDAGQRALELRHLLSIDTAEAVGLVNNLREYRRLGPIAAAEKEREAAHWEASQAWAKCREKWTGPIGDALAREKVSGQPGFDISRSNDAPELERQFEKELAPLSKQKAEAEQGVREAANARMRREQLRAQLPPLMLANGSNR
jgi:hypothetical protein